MNRYCALLRAVNVGGTGKLPMATLREFCAELGFEQVHTYIASGNVALSSSDSAAQVKAALEARLGEYAGRAVGVMVRTASELRAVLADNPFPDADPSRTLVTFLDDKPAADALAEVRHQTDEQMALGRREIYVHFPSGQGRSRLTIPMALHGTSRNINTVSRMAALTEAGT